MNLIYLFFFILILPISGQDDLLDILEDASSKPVIVESSFKGTRVVNAQSLELPRPKILQFMIQHRFGSIENGFYDLFGMDYATTALILIMDLPKGSLLVSDEVAWIKSMIFL